jgi:uncharacterized protein YbjT (DUF2867 family)
MTSSILVTGGTGTLGRLVTPLLRDAGATVRVLSRHDHPAGDGIEYMTGDLLADTGIEPAVDGAELVVHLAGGAKGDAEATRNLVRAASCADVRHLVLISVVGADRMPLGYFTNKLGAEQAVAGSGLPWTTLRTAQFHSLVLTVMRAMAKLPVIPVPGGLRFQPVDPGEPSGLVPDLVGPTVYEMGDLVRGYLRARGKRRPTLPVRMPGKVGRAYRAGENLSLAGTAVGTRTWEDFLAERVAETHR